MKKTKRFKQFMMSIDHEVYKKLQRIAKERGIIVQELIRAVIIPDWLETSEK